MPALELCLHRRGALGVLLLLQLDQSVVQQQFADGLDLLLLETAQVHELKPDAGRQIAAGPDFEAFEEAGQEGVQVFKQDAALFLLNGLDPAPVYGVLHRKSRSHAASVVQT